jgi:endonuclease YncB( thermonuclease family)
MIRMLGMAFLCGLCLHYPFCAAYADTAGQASVIDGDTLEIHSQRIRLFGIDAPEGRQTCDRDGRAWRCGQHAALALADKIGRRRIDCHERDRDRYRRIVAICYLNGEDLNGWLVRQGWALDYRQYSKGRYAAEEAEARTAKRGMWAGAFQKPWEWRRRRK